MKKHLKKVALVAAALAMLSFAAACTQTDEGGAATPTTQAQNAQTTTTAAEPEFIGPPDLSFPIVHGDRLELSYFVLMGGAAASTMSNYNEIEFFQYLEEKTNIRINWIHPTGGAEQFSLMVASRDLPDIINWQFNTFPGGPTALLEDGIIIPLDEDLMRRYAPNYMAIMDNNPTQFFGESVLDCGTIFQFLAFNYDPFNNDIVSFRILGPYIRQDWLDTVGLPQPATVSELETVLTAFRDSSDIAAAHGDITPFVIGRNLEGLRVMAGLFGTRNSAHMGPNGNIVFGPITENFRTYLTYMSRWYAEGLINSDFPVLPEIHSAMLNSSAGFTIGSMGSGLTMTRLALQDMNPDYNLVSIAYPFGPYGHRAFINDAGGNPRATAISSSNQHVIETLRWLDYAYSPGGSITSTFGIEGVSFNWVDGFPTLSDYVMNNPHGFNQEEAIARFAVGPFNYPNARDVRFYEQVNLVEDWQIDIQNNWDTATTEIMLPPLRMTVEEARRFSNIMTDITTHTEEMMIRFIIGAEPMSEFDNFVNQIQRMGIDDALAIQEQALERFRAR